MRNDVKSPWNKIELQLKIPLETWKKKFAMKFELKFQIQFTKRRFVKTVKKKGNQEAIVAFIFD